MNRTQSVDVVRSHWTVVQTTSQPSPTAAGASRCPDVGIVKMVKSGRVPSTLTPDRDQRVSLLDSSVPECAQRALRPATTWPSWVIVERARM